MIWLASGSPRRLALLHDAGFQVSVHPPQTDETPQHHEAPCTYVTRLARAKADTAPHDVWALAADTIVWRGNDDLLGKPLDRDDAARMLRSLSGQAHHVSTGVCIRFGDQYDVFSVTTEVAFRTLTPAEIAWYLDTGEADDKAGAYAIQGRAAGFVRALHGSWTNVMGLPMEEVVPRLRSRQ